MVLQDGIYIDVKILIHLQVKCLIVPLKLVPFLELCLRLLIFVRQRLLIVVIVFEYFDRRV